MNLMEEKVDKVSVDECYHYFEETAVSFYTIDRRFIGAVYREGRVWKAFCTHPDSYGYCGEHPSKEAAYEALTKRMERKPRNYKSHYERYTSKYRRLAKENNINLTTMSKKKRNKS
jgi:hypothetical protein